MPVYRDKARNRWRYEFSRIVGGRRRRATKLLPAPWNRAQAEAYARDQDGKLYALATGATRQQPLISEAVRLYLEQHAPRLKNAAKLERDLALLMPYYQGRGLDELPQVCRDYAAKAGVSLATIKVRLAYLRAACRWAWKTHNLGDHDPGERVSLPSVSNERQRYVPRKTVLQIARAMNHRQARAVALVSFYSCRASQDRPELVSLGDRLARHRRPEVPRSAPLGGVGDDQCWRALVHCRRRPGTQGTGQHEALQPPRNLNACRGHPKDRLGMGRMWRKRRAEGLQSDMRSRRVPMPLRARAVLKIPRRKVCRFESGPGHQ